MKNVLIGPIITERSMANAKEGKFSFFIEKTATKKDVRNAVQTQFSVDVIQVDTLKQKGRSKRVGIRRVEKTLAPVKKAIVTLKAGQKIDIFDLGV